MAPPLSCLPTALPHRRTCQLLSPEHVLYPAGLISSTCPTPHFVPPLSALLPYLPVPSPPLFLFAAASAPASKAAPPRAPLRTPARARPCSYNGQRRRDVPDLASGNLYIDVGDRAPRRKRHAFHHELFHLIDYRLRGPVGCAGRSPPKSSTQGLPLAALAAGCWSFQSRESLVSNHKSGLGCGTTPLDVRPLGLHLTESWQEQERRRTPAPDIGPRGGADIGPLWGAGYRIPGGGGYRTPGAHLRIPARRLFSGHCASVAAQPPVPLPRCQLHGTRCGVGGPQPRGLPVRPGRQVHAPRRRLLPTLVGTAGRSLRQPVLHFGHHRGQGGGAGVPI
eukprot:scaffold6410_cov107-Isochrysis_galbana.AAC.5